MRVTEHMRCGPQPRPLRELAEQIDGRRIPHRSTDLATPPIHEDIVLQDLHTHEPGSLRRVPSPVSRHAPHTASEILQERRYCLRVARYRSAIVRPDVGMTKAQSLPDPHPALVQQAQKESIPQMCAG